MFSAYVPKITLPAGKSDIRKGGGIGIICEGQVMLVDGFEGGEPTNGMKAWLAENGVSTVNTAVLTHVHYDHYHGLLEIEEDSRFHIELVLMYDPLTLKHGCDGSRNGRAVQEDMDNAYKFIRAMQSHGTKVRWIDKGGVVKCGDTSWKVYRNQPRHFTDEDDGNAYAFVNDGSLTLCSPEVPLLFGGDGCVNLKDAIAYFKQKIIAFYVQHHGNHCTESNAKAAKNAGAILAWETNVERNGAGTTDFTLYGARRVKQAGIPVWMQDEPIYISASNGKITFKQGSKTMTADIPYNGKGYEGWVHNIKGWWYRYSDGSWATGWKKIDGKWYYFDADGYRTTGWQKVNGKWYYLDTDTGVMRTGWIFVNGIWYYLEDSGAMHTGWMEWKGKKCYLEPDRAKNQGHAYRNQTAVIDGKTYRFDDGCYATEIKTTGEITSVSGKLNDIAASRRQFVIDIANYVRKYAPQYDIKVYSPVIAQAIHESGWGESKLSAKYHNYFGLKCGTKWTGKSVNMSTQEEYSAGTLTTISANFRVYDNMEEGVKGYFEFIQLARYANLKGITSPRKYLETIIADGYATGKQYVDHVMNLINLYNLTQFDVAIAPTPSKPTTDANPVDVLLQIASAEVGYHEGANNKNKYGDELHKIQPSNMDINAAWCDAFADWTVLKTCEAFGYGADMAREVLCGDFDDYTYASINLYKKQSRWSSSPARGYQIFFGGSGHTGWVETVDSQIHTIEGNKSDQVMRCTYALNDSRIIGYGMPKYELLSGGLTAENMPLIKKGATGFAVVELQKRLNACSYEGKTMLTVDGDFGNKTYNALKAYQKDRGLEVDGECGKNSWKSLFNEV